MTLYGAAVAAGVTKLTDNTGGATPDNVCANGALTDSTGGTADGTLADVGGAFNQATLNNNFADCAAKINAVNDSVRECVAKLNEMLTR